MLTSQEVSTCSSGKTEKVMFDLKAVLQHRVFFDFAECDFEGAITRMVAFSRAQLRTVGIMCVTSKQKRLPRTQQVRFGGILMTIRCEVLLPPN